MTLGLVGCGRMGTALALGALKANAITAKDLLVFDINSEAVTSFLSATGASAAESLPELITRSDTLLLCTKPPEVSSVLKEVAKICTPEKSPLVLSIAAGVTLPTMERLVGDRARVIRAMPNTPSLVGQGATAFALGTSAHDQDAALATALLGSVGEVLQVEEILIDAITGLSGSGPAYVYLFIEALIEAGIAQGLTPEQAHSLTVQTVLGAATMVRETGQSPAALREMVSSPGGTTLAGLEVMEDAHIRQICHETVSAATQRSQEMGQ